MDEALFWGMLAVVLGAMMMGVAAGQTQRLSRSLFLCVGWAAVAAAVVATAQPMGAYMDLNIIAAAATFLFSVVIGSAIALVTRRIRSRRHPSV